MKRLIIPLMFAAAACGDNLDPEDPIGPAEPAEPDPPVVVPADLPPEAGGEYAIKVSPTSFSCVASGPQDAPPFYAMADIVPQGPYTIDLLSDLRGSFAEYDRRDLQRDTDGRFQDSRTDYASFAGYPLTVKRRIEGAADGRTLDFFHRFDVGWDESDGSYHSECVFEADVQGDKLYQPWDGSDKDGVSGQWWVTKTVLADPTIMPKRSRLPENPVGARVDLRSAPDGTVVLYRDRAEAPIRTLVIGDSAARPIARRSLKALPARLRVDEAAAKALRVERSAETGRETDGLLLESGASAETTDPADDPLLVRKTVIATLSQSPGDGLIDVRGIYREFPVPLIRAPLTGKVAGWMLIIVPYVDSSGANRTMLQETTLSGAILPTKIDLNQTWHWWTAATETLPANEYWFQHELYQGVPRYLPHDSAQEEVVQGTYLAEYALLANDCGYDPYVENRFLRLIPIDGGQILPHVTGFDLEPPVTPAADGSFQFGFTRSGWSAVYAYSSRDAKVDGHSVSMKLDIKMSDPLTGALVCSVTYEIAGEKLYMTARP